MHIKQNDWGHLYHNPAEGTVKLNSIEITDPSWNGEYFGSSHLTLSAKPNEGYEFVAWLGSVSSAEKKITIDPGS